MTAVATVERLRDAVAAGLITFDGIPDRPVAVTGADQIGAAEVAEIVRRYRRHGFAVAAFAREPWTERTVSRLADALGLGEPFVPPLYTRGGRAWPSITRISAAPPDQPPGSRHPHFETTVGQDLHCDGTLQDIGVVKAAILLCQSRGLDGGTTTVFNAQAAFAALLEADPPAAQALTMRGVLVRQATFNESSEINESPVFAVEGDQLVCRYCVDVTDRWSFPERGDATAIARGLAFLDAARAVGSRYIRRFDLAPGQALVIDNTRISHGRDPYRDSGDRRRCLYRSLHLRHPRGE